MIVHQVKIGDKKAAQNLDLKHRTIYVGCADTDLKYREMLVHCRHRWELYVSGALDFSTCDREGLEPEQWQQLAAEKIRGADGVFMLVSENTCGDEGAVWEIDFAIATIFP